MKHKVAFIFLSAVVVLGAFFTGCAIITGEDPGISVSSVTPPRWVWSNGSGDYSIIVGRQTHEPIRDVTPDEAFFIIGTSQHSENPVVIDVRTPQEYHDGHIRAAVNIDYLSPSFRDELGPLDKTKLYIVYCRTGVRSSAARDIMEATGFKHIINVTGGYADWLAAGLPVDK